ncbi:PPE family protein [Mycobacterium tuberculosis]|nr:PPE family protein [Mycobacterium tuberculosis]
MAATTAEHAHKTAIQLTAAANAYEQARAAMVPPAMVRANRVQTTVLKAINWFGQFSTRIADKEADYEQMWFQDALVMENYWEAVQEAIQSTSHFEDPPEMADDYDEAWMLNTVFDYHNENAKEEVIHLVPDVNKERGPIELVTKVDKEGTIRLVYDGEPTFSYKEHPKF